MLKKPEALEFRIGFDKIKEAAYKMLMQDKNSLRSTMKNDTWDKIRTMMSDYITRRNCDNLEEEEKSGYKCHCIHYGTYEDPDEVKECKGYRERS